MAYFGETESKACGQCDYCLQLHTEHIDQSLIDQLTPLLQQALEQPKNLQLVLKEVPFENKIQLIEVIRWHIEQNIIHQSDDEILSWGK